MFVRQLVAATTLLVTAAWAAGCGGDAAIGSAESGTDGDAEATDATGGEAGSETGAEGDGDETTGAAQCGASPGSMALAPEGDYVGQGAGSVAATRDWCEGAIHATAGAAGSTLKIRLDSWEGPGPARIRVEDLLGAPMVEWTEAAAGDEVTVELVQSGEILVRIEPVDVESDANGYALSAECTESCAGEFTRYPVLMMHGMAGTTTYINILDYWFRLPEYVAPTGLLMVIREVDAFNGVVDRSIQWKAHIDALVAEGVGRKFNLIGHSQGGLDARYVTSVLDTEGRVASVITVASPHRGTSVADLAIGAFSAFNVSQATIDGVIAVLGGLLGLSGTELVEQMEDMSTEAMASFNDQVLDVPGVYYASWSGRSCGALDLGCQVSNNGEIVDPIFSIPYEFMRQAEGDNDGVTGVESCKWGDWQGSISADHMDEVGQIADFINLSFDHRAFFLGEIRRLASLGY